MTKHTGVYRNTKITQVLTPAVLTDSANSASVDMKGFADLTFLCSLGISGDTLAADLAVNLEMEHSNDNSAWVDCLDSEVTNPVVGATNTGTIAVVNDPAEDDLAITAGYKGTRRYVRLVYNAVGTHEEGTAASILAIQSLRASSV
jgi:hypothetical protein